MFSAKHILVCLPVEKSSSETVVLFPFSIVVSSKRRLVGWLVVLGLTAL